jgi:hypothetical protein
MYYCYYYYYSDFTEVSILESQSINYCNKEIRLILTYGHTFEKFGINIMPLEAGQHGISNILTLKFNMRISEVERKGAF